MNKVFKIVFNAARGTRMVVNETTSSVQSGKKAAVTVAVLGALISGGAVAETYNFGQDRLNDKSAEVKGYRIDVGDIASNEMFSFDDTTATLTLTGKQVEIGNARVEGSGALHAGVQVKESSSYPEPLQPNIVMAG